jgi:hypothetical protein
MDPGAMKVGAADIPALTMEHIRSLEENQLSLDFMNNDSMISDPAYGAVPSLTSCSIDWNSLHLNDTLTISSLDDWNISTNTNSNINQSGRISLQGDDADIEINGESVVGMLREIRDRLNIIQVSETMEAEWDELRVLRQQYEAKLAECRTKSQAWSALSAPENQKGNK